MVEIDRRPINDNWFHFIMSGKAIFTIENTDSGNRLTYRVKRSRNGKVHFVTVLSGPDNTSNYTYVGTVFQDGSFRLTPKSKVTEDSHAYQVFRWLNNRRCRGFHELPEHVQIWHEGRCGRCGRRLTVPESIESGFGPECIGKIGGM